MTKQAPPKLPTEVQNLVDREQLVALLDRYLATLDDGGFDDVEPIAVHRRRPDRVPARGA